MTEEPVRPDPDALLQRVNAEEVRSQRGKLKVFFGFAPGVGKTFRMLEVAHALVAEQRVDVVVGFVETHGRAETAALLAGLEVLPRRTFPYRGRPLEEFDLDGALTRRPRLLLLDELAHTNAPGSRHAKRWQDVRELLEAGIDVFTTVNVQHVESLNDVVAQITHVQVRETVPDLVIDEADEIELVDIAPEELLKRLHEGRVYVPEMARRAVDHFFRRGNLLALRELALRRTAQHVGEDVQEYRESHGVVATWAAGERILVCVGPAPSSARLIRAAARMAGGLRCPWVAVYVESLGGGRWEGDRERLETHLRLADSLGATVTRLAGDHIAGALMAYARKHNVTRIVLGKPTHSRLRDRLRGSLLDEVVRASGEIEVHVISGLVDEDGPVKPRARRERHPTAPGKYLWGAALPLLATAVAWLLKHLWAVPDLEVLYLLSVMIAAIRLGRGPAILAAALGVAAYDFFFVRPFFTFAVDNVRYFLTFAMMFGVGFVVSELTSRVRRQEKDALAREERTATLYALTRDLADTAEASRIAEVVAQHAADVFAAPAVVLVAGDRGTLQEVGASPAGGSLDTREMVVARWSLEHSQMAGLGTDTLPGAAVVCAPLDAGGTALGVLALRMPPDAVLRREQRELLDVFARQAAVALERSRLAGEARASTLRAKAEELRSTILSTVSHDFRTPLAAITGAATSLRHDENLPPATQGELVDSICEEAERLERLVANLLDMTRLESGELALARDWVPLEEVVGSALTRLETRLGKRPIDVKLSAELPLLWVDPVLLEQLFVNLLENAAKYTPDTAPIEVTGYRQGAHVVIEVADRGPGLEAGSEGKIFDRFFRGSHGTIVGAGLGLSICRGVAEAHGGTIGAENRAGGGALFRVTLPIGGEAPALDTPIERETHE